ncbi:MAG: PilZ domain-containing protein [Candidatus Omnitrophota bacterium]|nr:MAG: PilZ domain-containing protein [Candidatus Omnitrophota bacterium]
MAILAIESLIILICVMIFSTLIIDEKKHRRREMRAVKLKGFWDGSERRTVDRLNVTLEVKYSVNAKVVISKSADISTKGIRILLDEKIEKTTPLRLEIKIPNQNRIIKADGEVVWSEESIEDEKIAAKRLFNTGIKFSSFQNADEKKLFDFIYNIQP